MVVTFNLAIFDAIKSIENFIKQNINRDYFDSNLML